MAGEGRFEVSKDTQYHQLSTLPLACGSRHECSAVAASKLLLSHHGLQSSEPSVSSIKHFLV